MKKQTIRILVLVGALILIFSQIGFLKPATVVSTSASASTVCSIGEKASSCSISAFTMLKCDDDPDMDQICIEGVTADGMKTFFDDNNFYPNECEYSCSYRGFGGQAGSTGTVIGSVDDGCYASFRARGEYHGGNGFNADCSVLFREGEDECTLSTQCEGKPHVECVGSWSCTNGQCVWNCSDVPPKTILEILSDLIQSIVNWVVGILWGLS